ncbi:MAG TPA: TetR family transcriptional regulator [Caulobacteraceae bacterium]|nr:TetR family transcriptional regulator [Caulobacteraceae bacterium]
MSAPRTIRADALTTVDELIDVAERLFASEGVENVALTRIVAVSGQKNRSALHYHFGSRGGVLRAVLDRRLGPINVRRHALLDALPADASPYAVVRAEIAALAETCFEEPWGADYLSILAQVRFHPQLLGEEQVREENISSLRLAGRRLRAAAPQVPEPQIRRRLAWLADSAAFALARWMRDTPAQRRTRAALDALVDELSTYGTAGLLAAPAHQEPKA